MIVENLDKTCLRNRPDGGTRLVFDWPTRINECVCEGEVGEEGAVSGERGDNRTFPFFSRFFFLFSFGHEIFSLHHLKENAIQAYNVD